MKTKRRMIVTPRAMIGGSVRRGTNITNSRKLTRTEEDMDMSDILWATLFTLWGIAMVAFRNRVMDELFLIKARLVQHLDDCGEEF